MNSSIPANKDTKDDHPTPQPCFRKIGIAAVAAALWCARLPPTADERIDKHAHDPDANAGEFGDYWAQEERPWFGVP